MATTTWKWADDVFGKQKQNPDNSPTQYPDCGPSRVYTLENILYGLENVVTPLLQAIQTGQETALNFQDGSAKMTITTGFTSPTTVGTILRATIWLLSTASEGATIKVNSGAEVFLEAGYSMQLNLTSLTQIEAKGAAGGAVLYIVYTQSV